jgi:glutathione S-transferase
MPANVFLHHYPASLFSEKIRLMLGYLDVPWQSVEISSIMPRPLLMPLTGGYRKTPTLQIGANVFCDTSVITTGLVRLTGNESLLAPGFPAQRVAQWADSTLFRTTVALNFRPEAVGAFMSQLKPDEIAAFQADRAELAGDSPMISLPTEAAINSFYAYLRQLDETLSDSFLFGDAPSVADFAVYHCLWFVDQNAANAPLLDQYPVVRQWMERMASSGHGRVSESSAEAALAHAAESTPTVPDVRSIALEGVVVGDRVLVTPTDYGKVPVAGILVAASADEIVIERQDDQVGQVMTHFPTVEFQISAA